MSKIMQVVDQIFDTVESTINEVAGTVKDAVDTNLTSLKTDGKVNRSTREENGFIINETTFTSEDGNSHYSKVTRVKKDTLPTVEELTQKMEEAVTAKNYTLAGKYQEQINRINNVKKGES